MGLLFMILVGALLGWLAAIVRQIESARGIRLNIAAGVTGALLAGVVIGPLFGGPSLLWGNYRVGTLLLTLAGSLVLIVAVNAIWREQPH
jgi:uncharacterized membrane protein YeaQ/YmgE (transglycosylase-associated protein family)